MRINIENGGSGVDIQRKLISLRDNPDLSRLAAQLAFKALQLKVNSTDPKDSRSKNWRRVALTAPVIFSLLVGCIKGNDNTAASAALATATRTPTTEVRSTATPTSAPTPTRKEPTKLPPTKTIEATATATSVPTEKVLRNGGLFTELVAVGYGKEYAGKIDMGDGTFMSLPIVVGLEFGVEKPTLHGFKKVELDLDYVNKLADSFMHACWWRFTHLMEGNETVSYEKYLELVKQGKGMVEIQAMDESGKTTKKIPQLLKFDPRMGVSIVLADNRNLTLNMGAWIQLVSATD